MPQTRSASKAPTNSQGNTTATPDAQDSNSATISSLRSVILDSLAPLNQRLSSLETQLGSPDPQNDDNAHSNTHPSQHTQNQTPRFPDSPTRQLQTELEDGGHPEWSSVFARAGMVEHEAASLIRNISYWFNGVKSEHVRSILRNEFIPTNIVKLVQGLDPRGSRSEEVLIPRMNSSGQVEFTRSRASEEDHGMWVFFQAWEVYRGIFIWGAPALVRGELASALAVYTNQLFKLRKAFPWAAVRQYHFSFHYLQLENPATLYDPSSWRRVDSTLHSRHRWCDFKNGKTLPADLVFFVSQAVSTTRWEVTQLEYPQRDTRVSCLYLPHNSRLQNNPARTA